MRVNIRRSALLRHSLLLALLVCLGWGAHAEAQTAINQPPAAAACKTVTVNAKGSSNAVVTVDNTAGGVTVLDALATRCAALIQNEAGGGDMRCAFGSLAPTTTVGVLVQAGQSLSLNLEAQQAVKCIRTGSTSATVSTVEARP